MIRNGTRRRDTLLGGSDADQLFGLGGSDSLAGGSGNDTLDGGTGADTMLGAAGNDTYVVDSISDVVREVRGQGFDTVRSTVNYTLGTELERLILAGTANLSGSGNGLANSIIGNAGNNTLNGGAGADTLTGGTGNDTYYVDNAGDTVIETARQGSDTVHATVSYTLSAETEWLILAGNLGLSGTGNVLANGIVGNSGNNLLSGGAGNDTIEGGAGADTLIGGIGSDRLTGGSGGDVFRFGPPAGGGVDTGVGTAARDVITDFLSGVDHIDVSAWNGGVPFTFIGTAGFSAGSGPQLRYVVQDGVTVIQLDASGRGRLSDAVADAEIALSGTNQLQVGDIIGAVAATAPAPSPNGPPVGAIRVGVDADLQALVNAAAPGATFWLEAGIHRLQSVTPKDGQHFIGAEGAILSGARLLTGFAQSGNAWVVGGQTQQGIRRATDQAEDGFINPGHPDVVFLDNRPLTAVQTLSAVGPGKYFFDYATDRIYIGDNPAGRTVEAAVSPYAFDGAAANVTIQGLIIEKYASPVQYGAIGNHTPPVNWLIQDNEVRLNFGVGIIAGDNTKVLGNFVHDNGQMGLGGNGDNILVERNELADNGYFSGIDRFWEGGGAKFAETNHLVIRDNYSHGNNGYGFWTDIDNINSLYEGNRIEYNLGGGISHEISYAAVIRNNVFTGNGADVPEWLWGAAIQIQNSRDVEAYGNVIDMTGAGNGITLIQQERGAGAFGDYITIGNHVHNNTMIAADLDKGVSGAVADSGEDIMLNGGNVFDYNVYRVSDPHNEHWAWGEFYDWNDYRTIGGQDLHSTLEAVI